MSLLSESLNARCPQHARPRGSDAPAAGISRGPGRLAGRSPWARLAHPRRLQDPARCAEGSSVDRGSQCVCEPAATEVASCVAAAPETVDDVSKPQEESVLLAVQEASWRQELDATAAGGHTTPGRWSRGGPRTEEVKKSIGDALKRKWEDPDFRDRVIRGLKGKTPWNKGKPLSAATREKIRKANRGRVPWNKGKRLSDETRRRMSASKVGRSHSESARRKMSGSHTGKMLSPGSMRQISQRLSGVPKTEAHKAKISAAQKRRHAANRALRDIEDVHKLKSLHRTRPISACITPCPSGPAGYPRREQTRAEVLNSYKALLREYRAIQQELTPWMQAFKERHCRKPTVEDVEATQITWLVEKYKDYTLLRQKLMADVPILRDKLSATQRASINTVWPLMTVSEAEQDGKQQIHGRRPSTTAAAGLRSATGYLEDRSGNGGAGSLASGRDPTTSKRDLRKPLRSLPPNAPKRVQESMLAAHQYRLKNAPEAAPDVTTGPHCGILDGAEEPGSGAKHRDPMP